MRLLIVVAVLTQLTGCASYMVQMRQTSDEAGPDYVIMRVNGNTEKVFDCYSRPDGQAWDPTCVKVKFRSAAGSDR